MSNSIIRLAIRPKERDLGDFSVRRVLPSGRQPMVGPFIFFDHMGPAELPPGKGIDVRPHPHINLATVTYLFEGSLFHHDSLDAQQNIEPGAVNWMTAGRGITHSERSDDASRNGTLKIHGIQAWIALPVEHEECEPSFAHHPEATLPTWHAGGIRLRLIAGELLGKVSPVRTLSPMFYVDCKAQSAGTLELPADYPDRAVYIASGHVRIDDTRYDEGQMLVFEPDDAVTLHFEAGTRAMLLGGEPMPEKRHIWWNFVSSRVERIEQAKDDWRNARFDRVPGDPEFIPLPDK